MSGGITVKEFRHVAGLNDAEYIKLLEEHLEAQKKITSKAVDVIKAQAREIEVLKNIMGQTRRTCDNLCKYYDKEDGCIFFSMGSGDLKDMPCR